MKILFLNPSGQLGGAEWVLLDLLACLRETRPAWDLELLVTADGPLAAKAQELGAAVTVLKMPAAAARLGDSTPGDQVRAAARLAAAAGATVRYLMKLRAAVGAARPDIVHSNGFKMHVLSAQACPPRAALLWHIHDYVSTRPLMRRLMSLSARHCRIAIANSNHVAADVSRACGARLRVVRVYNGVDTAKFSPNGPALDLDRLAGLAPAPSNVIKIGLLGTMARWKGHRVFLRALARLADEIPLRGYVVGGPIYETSGSEERLDDLREIAVELGLRECVGFTGFVEEPAQAIRALDIVVHASTSAEPFGRVIAEAMASQKPVVVSRGGGASELISEEEDALAFAPGDHAGLAQQMMRLANDPGLRTRLAIRARRAALDRFDRRHTAAEMIGIYESLARPHGALPIQNVLAE